MADTKTPEAPKEYDVGSLDPKGGMKYQFLDPTGKWKADDFYDAFKRQTEFAELKPSDKKGLETILYTINAPVAKTWTHRKLEGVRDKIVGEAAKRIRDYSESNIPGLVGILSKEQAENYAASTPLFENKEDEKYAFIKSESERIGKRLAELRTAEGQNKYFSKLTEKMDSFSRQFWKDRAREHLQAVVKACQNYLTGIISKYDAKKLITKNFSVGKKIHGAFEKDELEIQKKMQEEQTSLVKEDAERMVARARSQGQEINLEEAVAQLASELPAEVQNKIREKYAPQFKELEKKYETSMPAIANYDKMIEQLIQETYQTIEQRKDYEKAKKEAEEKAKADAASGKAKVTQMPQEGDEEMQEAA